MATNYPINPRVRALGKARIDIARRAQTPAEWQKLWKPPAHSFPFRWGESWKQCVEYRVDDFAAEVGFFIDVLGLPVNALDPDYAMFTSPQGDFYFSVVQAEAGTSTPPDAIRLQFMVTDIFATVEELESRGIAFAQQPQAVRSGSTLQIATFLTPHGICIDLWGVVPSHRPTLAAIEDTDEEDIFLPGDETDDDLRLFTTQDADPLHTALPTPHNAPPVLPPAPARKALHQALPPLIGSDDDLDDDLADDLDDELEDELDDESELDDLAEEESDQDDDDDIEYVDIDTA
jgi:catechol 2,3-dioxygenase-like lactoylglutathione lyase family enzyme